MKYLENGDEAEKKKAAKAQRDIAMKAKIDNEIAPKIAV